MRTVAINFDLAAEVHQLWVALSIQWEMPLNGLAAWAIEELARHGVKVGKRPPDMGVGLKHPKEKFQSGNRYSKKESELWEEMKKRKYGRGFAEVLTVALIELYWRRPVDLSIANVVSIKVA